VRGINQMPINLTGQRRTRQASAYTLRNFGDGNGLRETTLRAIWQCNTKHIYILIKVKVMYPHTQNRRKNVLVS